MYRIQPPPRRPSGRQRGVVFVTIAVLVLIHTCRHVFREKKREEWGTGRSVIRRSVPAFLEENLRSCEQNAAGCSTSGVQNYNTSTWNYVIHDDLESASKCRTAILDIFKKYDQESTLLNGLSQILQALILIPVNPTVLYVGEHHTGMILREFFSVVYQKVECVHKVHLEILDSVEKYVQLGTYKNVTLVILNSPCEENSVSSLEYIVREGGMIYVASDFSRECDQISESFVKSNVEQVFINPMIQPGFPEIWESCLFHSVLAMDLEGWKTLFRGMGHISEVRLEIQQIHSLMHQMHDAMHVCEIGFNAGHSAILFLSSGENIRLTSFDLGDLAWSYDLKERVGHLFPGRFKYIQGNSRDTLSEYATMLRSGLVDHCDIMFVDGDHSYEGTKQHFADSIKIMSKGGILIVDDYSDSFPGVINAWKELIDARTIVPVKTVRPNNVYNGYQKGWAIGTIPERSANNIQSTMDIHVASTHCGENHIDLMETLVKSLILWSSPGEKLTFHLISRQVPEHQIMRLSSLLTSAKMKFEVYNARLDEFGLNLFVRCAMERLLLPQLLPNVSHVVYVDRDTIVMSSLGNLYRKSILMQQKAMAMSAEGYGHYTSYHATGETYYGVTGLNSGVLLMNLDFMRQISFTSKIFALIPETNDLSLGDQDLINHFFVKHPDLLMPLSCEYNYRINPDGTHECNCLDFQELETYLECQRRNNVDNAVVLHGNRWQFMNPESTLHVIWEQVKSTTVA